MFSWPMSYVEHQNATYNCLSVDRQPETALGAAVFVAFVYVVFT